METLRCLRIMRRGVWRSLQQVLSLRDLFQLRLLPVPPLVGTAQAAIGSRIRSARSVAVPITMFAMTETTVALHRGFGVLGPMHVITVTT